MYAIATETRYQRLFGRCDKLAGAAIIVIVGVSPRVLFATQMSNPMIGGYEVKNRRGAILSNVMRQSRATGPAAEETL